MLQYTGAAVHGDPEPDPPTRPHRYRQARGRSTGRGAARRTAAGLRCRL